MLKLNIKIFDKKELEYKFIGHLVKKGNRSLAVIIWYDTLDLIRFETGIDPLFVVERVIDSLKPLVIIKKRKRGGTVYQIPYIVQNRLRDQSALIAIRWLINEARVNVSVSRKFSIALSKVILDCFNRTGAVWKKKTELYDLALKNRVYVRFLFASKNNRRRFRF